MTHDQWIDFDILGAEDPARRERAEKIASELYEKYHVPKTDELYKKIWITTDNPYRFPNGAWFDPSWIVKPDGSVELREVSLMPGYLLDED